MYMYTQLHATSSGLKAFSSQVAAEGIEVWSYNIYISLCMMCYLFGTIVVDCLCSCVGWLVVDMDTLWLVGYLTCLYSLLQR